MQKQETRDFRNNKPNRRKLAILERRVRHLGERIASSPGMDLSYDIAEQFAIMWAVRIIKEVTGMEGDEHGDES